MLDLPDSSRSLTTVGAAHGTQCRMPGTRGVHNSFIHGAASGVGRRRCHCRAHPRVSSKWVVPALPPGREQQSGGLELARPDQIPSPSEQTPLEEEVPHLSTHGKSPKAGKCMCSSRPSSSSRSKLHSPSLTGGRTVPVSPCKTRLSFASGSGAHRGCPHSPLSL